VVLLLGRNVSGHRGNVGFAHGEYAVSGLPGKIGLPFFAGPPGRIRLDHTRQLGGRLRGTNPQQHMHVIGGATDDERGAAHFVDDASEVSEEVRTEFRGDQRHAALGAEN